MKSILLSALLLASAPVFSQTLGGTCVPYQWAKPLNADYLWKCEHISDPVTIKGIYEKGFRIVAFFSSDWRALVIEQQSADKK